MPVAYNPDDPLRPGGAIEGEKFVALEERLVARFGGFTKLSAPTRPVVEGQWRDRTTGALYVDRHRRYEIVSERRPTHNDFWLQLSTEWLALFRQETIFLSREAIHVLG